ncbi:MAG: hypothetical protein Q9226_001438 [Calogaya cf. arnoldii]
MIVLPTLTFSFLLLVVILSSKTHGQSTDHLNAARYQCFSKLPLQTTRCGELPNCAKALLSGFPNDIGNGEFHRGLPNNIWRLPRQSFVGDCSVVIDISEGQGSTVGSWAQVWTMANTLITACSYYMLDGQGALSAFTGGVVYGGRNYRLSITVTKFFRMGNSSQASEVTTA